MIQSKAFREILILMNPQLVISPTVSGDSAHVINFIMFIAVFVKNN